MKQLRRVHVFALILLAAIGTSARAQNKTIAVIVTAGHFRDRNVPSFMPNGKQMDAEYIKAGLTTYFQKMKGGANPWQFDTHIELATELDTPADRLATRRNILDALSQTQRLAGPGDAVIFYFSGHGGRRGDHFSLCPFDAALNDAAGDIQDRELGEWVRSLRTDNVTVILIRVAD